MTDDPTIEAARTLLTEYAESNILDGTRAGKAIRAILASEARSAEMVEDQRRTLRASAEREIDALTRADRLEGELREADERRDEALRAFSVYFAGWLREGAPRPLVGWPGETENLMDPAQGTYLARAIEEDDALSAFVSRHQEKTHER